MDFVGQHEIFKTLNGYSLANMPRSLLFIGEEGCGKKTLVKYLAAKLGLALVDVGAAPTPEQLIEWQQCPIKKLYVIDMTKLALDKDQNQFLKFVEEPSPYVYIVIIAESEAEVLQTIKNRCVKLLFAPYTVEQLKQIKLFDNEKLYSICRTPGKVKNASEKGLAEMQALCDSLTRKLDKASYANALSIVPRINYKDKYDKFDLQSFLDMLELTAKNVYIKEDSELAYKIYTIVADKRCALRQNGRIAKEAFMTNLMTELWKETR